MLIVLVPWVALLVFVVAVVARVVKILSLPVHVRWELYPVAHERNASYGGSFFEYLNWWKQPRTHSKLGTLKVMVPEILLLHGVHAHNRELWRRSFPFHFGLYCGAAFLGLLVVGALLPSVGVPVGAEAGGIGVVVHWVTAGVGIGGLVLAFFGALALLLRRLGSPMLRAYSAPADLANLVLFLAVTGLSLVAVIQVDHDLSGMRAIAQGALRLQPVTDVPALSAAAVILASVLFAYIPSSHMSHFFTKWFMYHDIRWSDEPNIKGGKIEAKVNEMLQYPVSWSAPHIRGDGKKNWVDVATSGVEE